MIPAYNSEAFLDKCLKSILLPELLDKLEILVVNDGSTDHTASIAEDYQKRYSQTLRLISQENRGHGGALNTGCAAAQGKYLKVIDADDWVDSRSLPAFVSYLEDCDSDVVLTHYHTIDIGTGEVKCWRSYPETFGVSYTFAQILPQWRNFDRLLTFHGITYRTEFYHRLGGDLCQKVFYEDHEYATFPCCHAESVTPIDLFLYEYRIGDASQSVSLANQCKRIGHTAAVLQRMQERWAALPESPGKDYASQKIQGLLLSYLTTALLVWPNRKEGRKLAKAQLTATPAAAAGLRKKYLVFLAMNRMHLGIGVWNKILHSQLYNRMRGNHSFE